ncbi:TldD/PmbA family protein [Candidatus Micrarchaeota archaeon]|nr:TldD/PmbA family protein [Candidatus Micrarchaeota archaeon]
MHNVNIEILLKKAEKECNEAEIFYASSDSYLFKTVLDRIESFDSSSSSGYGIRVVKGGRVGFSYFTDEKGFGAALKNALHASKFSNIKFSFPKKSKYAELKGLYSKKLASKKGEIAEEVIGMAEIKGRSHSNQNFVSYDEETSRIINSSGVDFESRENSLGATSSAQFKECVSSYSFNSREPFKLARVSQKAGDYAEKFQGGKKASGEYDIVLHPAVVFGMIEEIFEDAIDGEEAFRKQSPFTGKLGKKVANESFSLYDNPLREGGVMSFACDDEGIPAKRKPIIERGVLKNFIYDLKAASLARVKSSGNATRSFSSMPSLGLTNVEAKADAYVPFGDLDGVFVYDVIGMHNANALTGDFSLEISNAAFLKNGELTRPLSKCSITGNFFDVLKSVRLSDDFQSHGTYYGPSWVYRGKIV